MKSIIAFEANEIPVRLVEDHVARRPDGPLATLLKTSRSYETVCEDEVELDPWISWPTQHRGVIDTEHNILHLGQSLDWADEHYPPIWRLLRKAGRKVGVFGSLHSSNAPQDALDYAFYVPDYFARKAFAHPAAMLPFQEFNLEMTRRSARNVDMGVPLEGAARFGAAALANGLTVDTMAQIGSQLLQERLEPTKRIRRRNMQGVIGLDLFVDLLKRTRPDYASFYTNHVAAAMHRYWAAYFTGDYGEQNPMGEDWISTYRDEVPHAMNVLDQMVGKLMRYCQNHPGTVLMISSSLGQAAVTETFRTDGFTSLLDVTKLMSFLGADPSEYEVSNAMCPCVSVEIHDAARAAELAERLEHLEVMGARAKRTIREEPPLSFDLRQGKSLHFYFYWERQKPEGEVRLGNQIASLEETGFGFHVHEDNVAVSAHHIPEGFMAIYDPTAPAQNSQRTRVSTLEIAPSLLRHFGAPIPDYMKEPSLTF